MNIVKLQDDLKNVPDNTLVGYVQNPSGQVPSYLALSELQRRKKMREQATGAQAQGQSQMPSVAEQLVAEAAPQPGIAGIPVTNIGNEEAYAAGGIVAFEEGGNVQGYNEGKKVMRTRNRFLNADELRQLTAGPDFTLYPYDESARYLHPELSEETMRLVLPQMPVVGDYPQLKKPVEKPDWYTQGVPKADVADWYVQRPTEKPIMGKEVMPQAAPKAPIDAILNKQNTNLAAPDTGSQGGISSAGPRPPAVPSVVAGSAGLQGLVAPKMEYTPIPEADRTPLVDARGEMDKYMGLIGEDPYAAKAAERISKMEQANELYKQQFPWMALAEAGFGMAAGRSPFALQNIAEGGQRGVTALARGRKDVQEQEEKIFNAESKVAEAKRAVQLSAAKFGLESEQTAKANRRLEDAEERKAQREIEYRNKAFEVDIEKLKVTERNATIRANAALAAADKRAKTEDQKLEIASLRSAISSAQANAVSARKAYSDAVKTMNPTEIASAKEDLTAALQSLQYYQNLAEGNLGGSGYKPTASQEAAFKKYAK